VSKYTERRVGGWKSNPGASKEGWQLGPAHDAW